MFSYSITIGRNAGSEPMSDRAWSSFRNLATWALKAHVIAAAQAAQVRDEVMFNSFEGQGTWDGFIEQNMHAQILTPVQPDDSYLSFLKADLTTVAEMFEQDAIALLVGESELVYRSAEAAGI